MADLIPTNFREILSGFLFLIGIIFSFLSLNENRKNHSLRLTGLFFLSAIALFSNDIWCYFAAVFIVATAVTQLAFLQNLAAIIRGSKEYFDYQKEFLTQNEIAESVEKEAEEIRETDDETPSVQMQAGRDVHIEIDQSNLSIQHFAMICEEYAFRYLERKNGKPIQRHIRFRGKGMLTEFDGIMEMEKNDIVFELKITRSNRYPIPLVRRTAERMAERVKAYTLLTKRQASLSIILIGDLSSNSQEQIQKLFRETISSEKDVEISCQILSLKEIGLEGFGITENAEQHN